MAFLSLSTASFRNLSDIRIDTSAKDVFLVGENGQGKTNFLEALYFCAYASSFRGVKDNELVCIDDRCNGTDFSVAAVLGLLQSDTANTFSPEEAIFLLSSKISVKVEKSKKTIILDGKKITDRKELLDTVPIVVFCHEDMEFVSGGQEKRRWFFDQTQSLYDPVYLDDLRKYRRILKTRNTVLKDTKTGGDYYRANELLDVLDPQLAEYGLRLMEKRSTAAERFSAVFSPLYREVAGIKGITVCYAPSWKNISSRQETTAVLQQDSIEVIVKRLAERRTADIAQTVTLSGPHRDRYLYVQNNNVIDFSRNASTGQRRLLALLLRIAQSRCFSDFTGKTPVLLLDDVLLELDGEKRHRFLSVMPDYEQAFFTFLPEEPYKKYSKAGTLIYNVKGGIIEKSG
ncbi:MAG: DNA replication and repair protein RecF [Treponema sp.]|nr:DNA replication and repair protein RecF [Treponema sp.]